MTRKLRWALALALMCLGCSPDPAPAAAAGAGGQASRPELPRTKDWRADYPIPPRLSPAATSWYQEAPTAALEGIASRLMGNCSYESWRFAMAFFERAGPEGVDVVLRLLERALLRPDARDMAHNCCEALARARDPRPVPTLLRAALQRDPSIGEAAVQALGTTGAKDALRQVWGAFADLPVEVQRALVNASARALHADAVPYYAAVLREPALQWLWAAVLTQTKELAPAEQRALLEPLYQQLPPSLRLQCACMLYLAGNDAVGAEVLKALQDLGPETRVIALGTLALRNAEQYADQILPLVEDPSPKVQQAALRSLAKVRGENIDRALEVKVMTPEASVREAALRAYRERGLRAHLDRLLEDVRNKSGTVFRQACEDLVLAGDTQVVPVVRQRLPSTQGTDRRILLQTLAHLKVHAALPVLVEQFLAPDEPLGQSDELRSVAYVAVLLTNIEDGDQEMLDLFRNRLKDDPIRRAHLLKTLANLAGIANDPERRTRLRAFLVEVIKDRSRLTQERLLALDYATNMLTLDDAMAIKRQLADEDQRVRHLFNNWLWEFCGPALR